MLGHCNRQTQPMIATAIRQIFNAENSDQARDHLVEVVDRLRLLAPKVAGLLEQAEEELLAFYDFPREHWPKLRSTNPLERVNKEIGRRSDVVGIYPNDRALIRLAGTLLIEQYDCHEGGGPSLVTVTSGLPRKISASAEATFREGGPRAVSRHRLGQPQGCVVRADDHGEITEGAISADQSGLARLVHTLGPDVRGCIAMMSGAVWVRDQLATAGWEIQIADARKVKAIAPLACKTDRVDARVLAELVKRDLVPEVWVPSFSERELRERLRRRAHLVRLKTSATNRTFGLLTQWGLRANLTALRKPETLEQLVEDGLPRVWLQSIRTVLAVIDDLDRQIAPVERELRPIAHSNEQVRLPMTIPGIAELLGLTLVAEIGDISRFPTARKLVGYSGLNPTIKQSGQTSRIGRISKAGPNTLRWAAVEGRPARLAAEQPPAPAPHRHQTPARQSEPGQGRRRPQGADRLLAHPLAQPAVQTERLERNRPCSGKLRHSSGRLKAH